ncbi:MAG: M48 family metallopeptidase [Acholeplasmataceae bacterium]
MNIFFYMILSIILGMFVFEFLISVLNYRYKNQPIPENVQGLYDKDKYHKWLEYSMANFKFGIISNTISTAVMLLLLSLGAFGFFEELSIEVTSSALLQTLFFLLMYYIISFIMTLPLSYYRVFKIEESFGFNKMTKKLFVIDKIKSFILTVVFGGGIISLLFVIFEAFTNIWIFILIAYVVIFAVMLLLFLFNGVFVRLFNKLTLLEEGSLKEKIDALAVSLGFEVKRIYVMDGSRRSTKLNAFFSGLGKTKEVVLFDTLIEKSTEDQILAVLAHELGHATHKDTLKGLIQQLFVIGLYVLVLGFILTTADLHTAFYLSNVHFGFSIILMSILLSPVNTLLGLYTNYVSRIHEYKADAFAAKHTSKEAMISALKLLVVENFANLTPHPLYVKLYYSHPPISSRIASVEAS